VTTVQSRGGVFLEYAKTAMGETLVISVSGSEPAVPRAATDPSQFDPDVRSLISTTSEFVTLLGDAAVTVRLCGLIA
jgi:hypothetical protein